MTVIAILTRRVRESVLLFVIAFCQGYHRDDLHGLDTAPTVQLQEFPKVIIVNAIAPRLGCLVHRKHCSLICGAWGQGVHVSPEPFTPCNPTLGCGDPSGCLCIHPKMGIDIASRRARSGYQEGGGGYKHQLRPKHLHV